MRGIFLDTETNGLNPFIHRSLEIAFKIVDLMTGEELDRYSALIRPSVQEWEQSDPVSLQVNGISYELAQKGVPSTQVALEMIQTLQRNHVERPSAVFICQNPSFDRMFFAQLIAPEIQENLKWPYYWLDLASMYWTEAVRAGRHASSKLPWKTGFSKDKIAAAYQLPPEETPHRAMNGVDHLLLCYRHVVGFHKP